MTGIVITVEPMGHEGHHEPELHPDDTVPFEKECDNLPPEKMGDDNRARELIAEEERAANDYEQLSEESDDEDTKKIFDDIAREEKVHAGELFLLLLKEDPDQKGALEQAEGEVETLTGASFKKMFEEGREKVIKKAQGASAIPSHSDAVKAGENVNAGRPRFTKPGKGQRIYTDVGEWSDGSKIYAEQDTRGIENSNETEEDRRHAKKKRKNPYANRNNVALTSSEKSKRYGENGERKRVITVTGKGEGKPATPNVPGSANLLAGVKSKTVGNIVPRTQAEIADMQRIVENQRMIDSVMGDPLADMRARHQEASGYVPPMSGAPAGQQGDAIRAPKEAERYTLAGRRNRVADVDDLLNHNAETPGPGGD